VADLQDLLSRQQTVLSAQLGLGGAFTHPTARGDVSEFNWVEVFDRFLPNRYRVSRGAFVIDSKGKQTSEMDLVVHDNYFHPELFAAAHRRLIPAESVYAVFEIKQRLNKAHIKEAAKKAGEVRRLYRTNLPITHAGGRITEPNDPLRITAGILTGTSTWSDPLGNIFEREFTGYTGKQELDLAYAVEHGAFARQPRPDGSVQCVRSDADGGLLLLLTSLFARLQDAGSVPAIDLSAYSTGVTGTEPVSE
jgi:hypothetical protein